MNTFGFIQVDGGHATQAEIQQAFDVLTVTNVGVSTFIQLQDLQLEQNSTYYIYVMGEFNSF